MRLPVLLILLAVWAGCHSHASIPSLRPISKISAKVREVPELNFSAIDSVEVPEESIEEFAFLIRPVAPCTQTINPKFDYHVADVILQHPDGSTTTLLVRWTGHNPAGISLDDRNYYYGGTGKFPDGATRIVQLLNQYHFQSLEPDD
ncbi:hypothetical protein M4951_12365 [Blastopirellula sp. J2-11]|uniref:hypothetical protein n=1 Tax=Blastopirellula sp. J2-11 TaxID=2943192 RepID=UPI0021C9D7A4|nr:hypothetical protein [Blastopirellula sp. J2-11]UUO09079.1 hypothetical protein M4951_12365 [Blastopirellula sp. J2-11]